MAQLTDMPDPVTEAAAILREAADPGTHETGWQLLLNGTDGHDDQVAAAEMQQVAALARLMVDRDALIARAVNLRIAYVWGGGVEVAATANGNTGGEQDVDSVVQAFLADQSNADALCSVEAQAVNETSLCTDGNILLALFTNPVTGRVQVRVLPFDQIEDVVHDPDDSSTVWFYRRERTVRPSGDRQGPAQRVVTYHPALGYRPRLRPRQWGADTLRGDILWDAPVRHVRVNRQRGRRFGAGDLHPALPWARGYSEFLEDWARLVKALSRFAWKATAPTQSKASRLAAGILNLPAEAPAGSVATMTSDLDLVAIPKTGATVDSGSGRPLAAMVAAACDVPVTQLLADPGVTGARATAETLDKPTYLMASMRRELWAAVYRDVLGHVIDSAVRAPQGPLSGTVRLDQYMGTETVDLAGTDRTISVVFPPLEDTDPKTLTDAIVAADSTGKMPPRQTVLLLLRALGVDDAETVADEMFDDQGRFIDPDVVAQAAARQQDSNGLGQAREAYR